MSKKPIKHAEMRLYTRDRRRLYVNDTERKAFIAAAIKAPAIARIFCLTLVYTGCRLSEARYLKREDLQLHEHLLSFGTLKRRQAGQTREVPIPDKLMREFEHVHFSGLVKSTGFLFADENRPPPRVACYRWVKQVMATAGIAGPQACPKGLRHGYGVHATKRGVQLHMLQKWMGHASMKTTAIYATALGPEEQEVAKRMW